MANPNHLAILEDGVDEWNRWREENPDIRPDLKEANLSGRELVDINLSQANLLRANFRMANLEHADLGRCYLREGNLSGANLRRAHLIKAEMILTDLSRSNMRGTALNAGDLNNAILQGANLTEADLSRADLSNADLSEANLTGARLRQTLLRRTNLLGAELTAVRMGGAVFADVDLSLAKGVEAVNHREPSSIDQMTLHRSHPLPTVFLKGLGLSDWQIEETQLSQAELTEEQITNIGYRVMQLRSGDPIQSHSLFISYSREDGPFVDLLELLLDQKGIRFWRDIHDAVAGPLEQQVALAMQDSTVLLVLSQHSVNSDWVEWEATRAREMETTDGRHVLCPVALDDSWKTCRWPGRLRHQIEKYNILDFSNWREADFMSREFAKLLKGLDLFYERKQDG